MSSVVVNVRLPEDIWRDLRDVAEDRRAELGGRTSVNRVIVAMVKEALEKREDVTSNAGGR